mmetsp:Transcript_39258/g.117329  ORF Transcript_39258/g.117329 Transcript_39258/m.117329 type:complete len:238 (+) Transcript_39258:388-1101(+)
MQKPVPHHVAVRHDHLRVVGRHVLPDVVVDAPEGPADPDDPSGIQEPGRGGGVAEAEAAQGLDRVMRLRLDLTGVDVLLSGHHNGALEGEEAAQKLVAVEPVAKYVKSVAEDHDRVVVHRLQETPVADQFVYSASPLACLRQDLQREGCGRSHQCQVLVHLVCVNDDLHARHALRIHGPLQSLLELLLRHGRTGVRRHLPPPVQHRAERVRDDADPLVCPGTMWTALGVPRRHADFQ